jgi:hypothetical protein
MVEYFALDKILKQGVTYSAPNDEFLIIEAIGTNATTDAYLKIDGSDTGKIIADIAPLHKTASNKLGPLDISKLPYIVPPQKRFTVEGASGTKFRVIGKIGKLAVGEAVPSTILTRFDEQRSRYITYISGSKTVGTNVVWGADVEYEVLSLTPKTTEKYVLNRFAGAEITGGSFSEGDFAIRFYLDGRPLDNLAKDVAPYGIDVLSMPKIPTSTTEELPFTLEDTPIEVLGDHTLTVKAVNVSGSNKSPSSGSSWAIAFVAVVEYARIR